MSFKIACALTVASVLELLLVNNVDGFLRGQYSSNDCDDPGWLRLLLQLTPVALLVALVMVTVGGITERRRRDRSGSALVLLGLAMAGWSVATFVFVVSAMNVPGIPGCD